MFQVRQKSSLILVVSPSVSELGLSTFVLFCVVSVGTESCSSIEGSGDGEAGEDRKAEKQRQKD